MEETRFPGYGDRATWPYDPADDIDEFPEEYWEALEDTDG